MDTIDALWYGAVTPGEVLEKQDEKQLALARLIERNRAELAALHPEAGAILEKLEGNQAELLQLAVLGQEYGFLAALEMTKEKSGWSSTAASAWAYSWPPKPCRIRRSSMKNKSHPNAQHIRFGPAYSAPRTPVKAFAEKNTAPLASCTSITASNLEPSLLKTTVSPSSSCRSWAE